MKKIRVPLNSNTIEFKAGEEVLLSGTIFSARDQAHKRLVELIDSGKELPVSLQGQVFYYMGPAPSPEGELIGSCGPTTSSRMDPFTPTLMDHGLKAVIGKGNRSNEVVDAIERNHAVYFYAYGGCGVLYAEAIKKTELVAFEDLGPEAIYKLEVEDMPVMVAIDEKRRSIFK